GMTAVATRFAPIARPMSSIPGWCIVAIASSRASSTPPPTRPTSSWGARPCKPSAPIIGENIYLPGIMPEPQMLLLDIESLEREGHGVSHHDGKVVFVDGALPGEQILARIVRRKPSFDKARIERIVRASPQRTRPPCPHFGVCGGCAMQHLEPAAQMAVKQRALEDALAHIGKLVPQQILPAMQGPDTGYRFRARLSVRLVPKKGGVLVGFRERNSSYVADIRQCQVLPPHVSELLLPMRALVESLSRPDRIPQIEVAVGDEI